MKTYLFNAVAGLAAVSLLFVQCSKEDELQSGLGGGNPSEETVTITVRSAENHQETGTKTSIVTEGNLGKVIWNEGDVVDINGKRYPVIPDSSDPSVGIVENVAASNEYLAIYGTNVYSWSEEYLSVGFSSYPAYSQNTFADGYNPMVAYSTTPELQFRNAGGLLRIGIAGNGEEVRSVAVSTADGTFISGSLKIPVADVRDGVMADTYSDFQYEGNSTQCIELYPGDEDYVPVILSEDPEYFYFVVPPQTYPSFTVMAADMDGDVTVKKMTSPVEVFRSTLVPMAAFEFDPLPRPEVTILSQTSHSVTYKVEAEPGMEIRSAAVYGPVYDILPPIDLSGDEMAQYNYAISALWDTPNVTVLGADGTYTATVEKFYNFYEGEFVDMNAGTEYYIVASYGNSEDPVGGPFAAKAVTAQAEDAGPSLDIAVAEEESSYYDIYLNIKAGSSASEIRVASMPLATYQQMTAAGMDDRDIALFSSYALDEESLALAKGEGYLFEYDYDTVYPSTDYVFIVAAIAAGGGETVMKEEYTTPQHLPDNPQWEEFASDAYVHVYKWTSDGYEYEYNVEMPGMAVEKVSGLEIYRIAWNIHENDEFAQYMTGLGCTPDTSYDGTYLYLDLDLNNDDMNIYPEESFTGFKNENGESVYFSCSNVYVSEDSYAIRMNGFADLTSDAMDYDKTLDYCNISIEIPINTSEIL